MLQAYIKRARQSRRPSTRRYSHVLGVCVSPESFPRILPNTPPMPVFAAENACFATWCALFRTRNVSMRPHYQARTAALRGLALRRNQEIIDMFATIARWSHNTLLLAMALLTAALLIFAI